MSHKKIVFLTGTRADYGKLKSLINITQSTSGFHVHLFVTGMHMQAQYGKTINEIIKSGHKNIESFNNVSSSMDISLSKTISGFSKYIKKIQPDLVVVHGDRLEALAGAIVCATNNVLVAHIEGGEVSGTIDESIRHAVSKFSHIHFTTDNNSKKRLIQLGEHKKNIFVIGSPDFDLMKSKNMINIQKVKEYYGIPFKDYGIVLFHPVTTEVDKIDEHTEELCKALIKYNHNYVVIFPNNDLGSEKIIKIYKNKLKKNTIKIFPSLRFEYFLSLLKHASFIIGNSSCGLREAPFFKVPTINIGTRQKNRSNLSSIINIDPKESEILNALKQTTLKQSTRNKGISKITHVSDSDKRFIKTLKQRRIWNISKQKFFNDLDIV
jgi:UDP-N-acetylglucosamine 2-epimerase (hydrolysing)